MAKKVSKKTVKKTEKKTVKAAPKLSLVAKLKATGTPAGPIGFVRKVGLDARHYNPGAGGKVNFGR